MTNQEIFDKVVTHLKKQNAPAIDTSCRYRTNDGKKCAAGCLIPDKLYNPSLEHKGIQVLIESKDPVFANIVKKSKISLGQWDGIVRKLQYAHDNTALGLNGRGDFWDRLKPHLEDVAKTFSLNNSILN